MALQYVGLNEINGSLVVLDHVKGASYDEMVEIQLKNGTTRSGRVVQIEGEKIVVQVFEGTNDLSLENTKTKLLGRPMELPVSKEILGRVFNGAGRPIDGLGEIYAEEMMDINGLPLNPVSRVYPRNYINTGISSIDYKSLNKQKLLTNQEKVSPLSLRQWVLQMTLQTTLNVALKKQELWKELLCS